MKFEIDLNWISSQARSQQEADSFGVTSVGLANLVADLSPNLSEEDLAPLREKIATTVQLLGELLPLVTPEEVKVVQSAPMSDEDVQANAINPQPTPAHQKPSATRVKPLDDVSGILKGMGASGGVAAQALGIKPQKAPTPAAASPTPAVTASSLQMCRESARVKAVHSKFTAPNAELGDTDDADALLTNPIVKTVLGEDAKSVYEASVVLAEIWRKE